MDDRPSQQFQTVELVARFLAVGLGVAVFVALYRGPGPLVVLFLIIGAVGLSVSVGLGAKRWMRQDDERRGQRQSGDDYQRWTG